ncbi:MAG: hypothetical protein R3D28_06855 [Geminicoccaceae bacterium]
MAGDENIELLGQVIGINLVVEAIEKPVGTSVLTSFVEAETSRLVLIENGGAERSSASWPDSHLAAGSETGVVIWIVSRLRPEHRAAIDWLNRITAMISFSSASRSSSADRTSPPAPRFNVVVEPNEWQRSCQARGAHEFQRAKASISIVWHFGAFRQSKERVT